MEHEPIVEKKKRGFANLSPEARRDVAAKGGKTAHALGKAHRWTPEEASLAGKKSGVTNSAKPDYMKELGRRGGIASGAARKAAK
jgi:general stress protein YciG